MIYRESKFILHPFESHNICVNWHGHKRAFMVFQVGNSATHVAAAATTTWAAVKWRRRNRPKLRFAIRPQGIAISESRSRRILFLEAKNGKLLLRSIHIAWNDRHYAYFPLFSHSHPYFPYFHFFSLPITSFHSTANRKYKITRIPQIFHPNSKQFKEGKFRF